MSKTVIFTIYDNYCLHIVLILLKCKHPKMLKKYLCADKNKNYTAGKRGILFEFYAKSITNLNAEGGNNEGNHTDKRRAEDNIHLAKRKGNANRKGINACRYGKADHGAGSKGAINALVLVAAVKRLNNHFSAETGKHDKRHPVVNYRYVFADCGTEKPHGDISDNRHQRLKSTKPQTGYKHVAKLKLRGGETLANRDGARITRKPDCNNRQGYNLIQ